VFYDTVPIKLKLNKSCEPNVTCRLQILHSLELHMKPVLS